MLNLIQRLMPFTRTIRFYDRENNLRIARGSEDLFKLLSKIDNLNYKRVISRERTERFKKHIDEILDKGINVFNHNFDYNDCYNLLGFGNIAGFSDFTTELTNNGIIVRYIVYINKNGIEEIIEGSILSIQSEIPRTTVRTFFKFKKLA